MSKLQKLQFQFSLAVVLLISVLVSGFFIFSPVSIRQIANAIDIPANYSKIADGELNETDWNRLATDFVAIDAGTANDLTVNDIIINGTCTGVGCGGSIKNESGVTSRMVCGISPVGGWMNYGTSGNTVMTVVNTGSANFGSDTTRYIVSLSGTNAGPVIGLNSIYDVTADSFELHILYLGWPGTTNEIYPGITFNDANTWGWQVCWCGIGE